MISPKNFIRNNLIKAIRRSQGEHVKRIEQLGQDIFMSALIFALAFVVLSLSACAQVEAQSADTESAPAAPSPEVCAPPLTAVNVVLKNTLVGEIRQIAMGADGWTAIVSAHLRLHCTISGDTVTCEPYAYEPYPYEVAP